MFLIGADPYHFSLGAEALLTIAGGKHGFGGIAGYEAKETDKTRTGSN